MADKRKAPPLGGGELMLSKRARQGPSSDGYALIHRQDRTSSLAAPVMALTEAHTAEILDVKFAPDGFTIAAASCDRTISLWETFGEHRNIGQLAGHKNAVTCLAWVSVSGDDRLLVSGSADGTLVLWKTSTGERIRRLRGHRGIVNSVACTRSGDGCIASASDDGRVLFWDLESRYPISSLELGYPVTCVEFSDDAAQLFVGGVDNAIHVIDLATKERVYSLLGHTNSVTSLSLSRTGTHLLSCGLDDTVRVWDVRPYAAPKVDAKGNARLHRTLLGMASGFENLLLKAAWSPDGECVACGGADHTSNIWNVEKGTLLFKLPGHRGTCTAVDFHPREPILVSASTDCTMLLGELDSD